MLLVLSIAGGKGTLETIRDSLKSSTPVVLVTGFGRATDLLEFAIQVTKESNRTELPLSDFQGNETQPPIKYGHLENFCKLIDVKLNFSCLLNSN